MAVPWKLLLLLSAGFDPNHNKTIRDLFIFRKLQKKTNQIDTKMAQSRAINQQDKSIL
jgi:hypothetical protein